MASQAQPKGELNRTIGKASLASVVSNAASAIGGLLAARYLGPGVNGQYAAVTAWFGASLTLGEIGQQSAIVYYVAREPSRAQDYVTTSRSIMVVTGVVAAIGGILIAPTLSHGHASETLAYRALFAFSPVAFVGTSYLFALQARKINRWILTRAIQPAVYLTLIVCFILVHRLSLDLAVVAVAISIVVQAIIAWMFCAKAGLLGGRIDRRLGRSVLGYGASQLLAATPTAVNVNLDQLMLSQMVQSSKLGQYSVAASLTALTSPFLAPIGSVLFPRLASGHDAPQAARRLQWVGVIVTAALGALMMAALAAVALPLIPIIFGHRYRPSVDLVWIMAPSGVFLALNQVMGDLLRGRGQPLTVAVAQGVGAALTVAMLVILIPALGATGAAITTTVTYGLTTVIMLFGLRRRLATDHE